MRTDLITHICVCIWASFFSYTNDMGLLLQCVFYLDKWLKESLLWMLMHLTSLLRKMFTSNCVHSLAVTNNAL